MAKKVAKPEPFRTLVLKAELYGDDAYEESGGAEGTTWVDEWRCGKPYFSICEGGMNSIIYIPKEARTLDFHLYKDKPRARTGIIPIKIVKRRWINHSKFDLDGQIDGRMRNVPNELLAIFSRNMPVPKGEDYMEQTFYILVEWS